MDKPLRLERLRELAAEVHRLPRSHGRDHLLRKLRGRAVEVDTGASDPSGWRDQQALGAEERETDREGLERGLNG